MDLVLVPPLASNGFNIVGERGQICQKGHRYTAICDGNDFPVPANEKKGCSVEGLMVNSRNAEMGNSTGEAAH